MLSQAKATGLSMEKDAAYPKLEAALYLVSTPIGNLEDITLRAIRVLKSADAVYCEDTRNSAHLMEHIGAKKPLISCHEHNERQRGAQIAARVAAGEAAGAPAVPGQPPLTDHCPLCALLGDRLGPPPTPWAPPALAQRHAPPAAARPGSPAPRWAIAAPPRGPPPPVTPVTA